MVAARGVASGSVCPPMPDRIAVKFKRAIMLALFTGACLGGCTSTSQNSVTFFADPGKYEFSSCQTLAAQRKNWQQRQQELKLRMDKAERSPGGGVVNLLAYQADYTAAGEELNLVERSARQKNCDLPENWGSNSAIR
jgi:hypothetical protein